MSDWGRRTFGDPCRGCGFAWNVSTADARGVVSGLPARLRARLRDATGDERHPTLTWSVTAYVLHVGDNLRIWAERIAGVTLGGSAIVASYDENDVAAARGYDRISLPAALWSTERAVADWVEAVRTAPPDLVMVHPERGSIGLDDVVRTNAHDAAHHEWDIARTLAFDLTERREARVSTVGGMEQRVSLITIGVEDVARAKAFYEALGWRGQEVEETVFFQAGGSAIVLWGRAKLAEDAGLADAGEARGFAGIALAHNVRTRQEVDEILAAADAAGGHVTRPARDTFYGGYAGYFADPDGHLWEIAHNPGFTLNADGTLTLPDFGKG